MILEYILLMLVLLLGYAWVLYPVGLGLRSRYVGVRYPVPADGGGIEEHDVCVLLAAYNEEKSIALRLENLLETVPQGTRIYVGVDGSADCTAEIAHRFATQHAAVHVCEFKNRRGKVAVLKDLVAESVMAGCLDDEKRDEEQNAILVFTDANTVFHKEAIEKLLCHFNDQNVGGVCGRLVLRSRAQENGVCQSEIQGDGVENSYWRWEAKLKKMESGLDSCLGANGSIYAIRRELFWHDIPGTTIVDDFVIGMKIREYGKRMVYDSAALAEEYLPDQKDEWSRRIRIGSGDYQALRLCSACLLPKYGTFALIFWSHKVLRWFTPHIILTLFIVSSVLVLNSNESLFARIVMVTIGAVLGCGLVGTMTRKSQSVLFGTCQLVEHFLVMQFALFIGFLKFCRGGLSGAWERTER